MKIFRLGFFFFILSLLCSVFPAVTQEAAVSKRLKELASEVSENSGINSEVLIGSVESVPRLPFLPENRIDSAYEDRTIHTGSGMFIPSPSDILSLLSFAGISPVDRVLIIGCSTGYISALIQSISPDITICEKSNEERTRIRDYFNSFSDSSTADVAAVSLPEILGLEELAFLSTDRPFSLIIIQGSSDEIPPVVFSLLEPGGRIAGALEGSSGFSILFRYDKNSSGGRITTDKEVYFPVIGTW